MLQPLRCTGAALRLAGCCLLTLLWAGASPAEAKRYSADRYDSRVEVLTDGSLRVTETVVFRFESGTFREVFREIRTGRTDGVDVEGAAMDGQPMPEGEGPGTIQVRRGRRVRVTWRFEPTSGTTRAFELTYRVHGAIREDGEADVLLWRVLPGERKYRIAASTVDVLLPAVPIAQPVVHDRRVGSVETNVAGNHVRVNAETIRANGRIELDVRLPRGSVLDEPPAWQARDRRQAGLAPQWVSGGGLAVLLSLIALVGIRQHYDTPKHDPTLAATGPSLPDTLAPAEAGALVSNGGARFEHALATLLALAERGDVTVTEEPRGALRQRRYRVTRRASRRPAAPYEEVLLEAIFTHKGRTEEAVTLDKARARLISRFKRFRTALDAELRSHGLLDDDRRRVRDRMLRLGIGLLIVAAALPLPLVLLLERDFGLWPLFIPLGIALGGLATVIAHAAHTPLSNEGLRRARYWRGFRDYLRDVAGHEAPPPADGLDRLLPYAVALGLAVRWSKFLKDQRLPAPAWFHPATAGDAHPAFSAFVAFSGTMSHSGGGIPGAAGGGASGAR